MIAERVIGIDVEPIHAHKNVLAQINEHSRPSIILIVYNTRNEFPWDYRNDCFLDPLDGRNSNSIDREKSLTVNGAYSTGRDPKPGSKTSERRVPFVVRHVIIIIIQWSWSQHCVLLSYHRFANGSIRSGRVSANNNNERFSFFER